MGSRNLSLYVGRSATKYHPDRSFEERARRRFTEALTRNLTRVDKKSSASRPRLDRGSNQCGVYVKEKPPLPGALISNGAAYRIRTYDVLIRSQTLYPAEVTPRLVDYYAQRLNNGQAFFRKKLSNRIFTHLRQFGAAWIGRHSKPVTQLHRHIKKPPLPEAFKINWCGV